MKKVESETENANVQEKLICPVCGKEFPVSDDTKYIVAGGYTCNWKCFLTEVRRTEAEKKQNKGNKK